MADGGAITQRRVNKHHKPGDPQNRALASLGKPKAELATEIIEQYLNGKSLRDQANQYGVSRYRVNQLLLDTAADEWRSAQCAYAWARWEDAKEAIESASDALALARARESAATARFELERLNRRLFGQDQPLQGPAVQISINLGNSDPKPINE